MFQQNAPHLLDNQRVPLAGVAVSDNEFRFYIIDVGAGVFDHPVVAIRRFFIPFNCNDGMALYARRQGNR